jgi:hypothetical protein
MRDRVTLNSVRETECCFIGQGRYFNQRCLYEPSRNRFGGCVLRSSDLVRSPKNQHQITAVATVPRLRSGHFVWASNLVTAEISAPVRQFGTVRYRTLTGADWRLYYPVVVGIPTVAMTPEETAEMHRLCNLIQVEKDRHKFLEYVTALNNLLERKENRLEDQEQTQES